MYTGCPVRIKVGIGNLHIIPIDVSWFLMYLWKLKLILKQPNNIIYTTVSLYINQKYAIIVIIPTNY